MRRRAFGLATGMCPRRRQTRHGTSGLTHKLTVPSRRGSARCGTPRPGPSRPEFESTRPGTAVKDGPSQKDGATRRPAGAHGIERHLRGGGRPAHAIARDRGGRPLGMPRQLRPQSGPRIERGAGPPLHPRRLRPHDDEGSPDVRPLPAHARHHAATPGVSPSRCRRPRVRPCGGSMAPGRTPKWMGSTGSPPATPTPA